MKITSMPPDSVFTRQIRESLQKIADAPDCGPGLRDAVKGILSGESDITTLLTAPGIDEAVHKGMQLHEQQQSTLTAEKRQQQDEAAASHAAALLTSDPMACSIELGNTPFAE